MSAAAIDGYGDWVEVGDGEDVCLECSGLLVPLDGKLLHDNDMLNLHHDPVIFDREEDHDAQG